MSTNAAIQPAGLRPLQARHWVSIAVLILAVWGITDVRSRGRVDPQHVQQRDVHMTDVTVYTEAGAAIFAGLDPYEAKNPRGWHYLYPPLFAILLAPLASLDPQWQVMIWFAISVLAGCGCFWECRRLLAWLELPENLGSFGASATADSFPGVLLWLTVATILLPVLNCLQRGQLGVVLLYFLLLGLRMAMTARNGWTAAAGGIVLALPVAIKLTPALPVAFLCWQSLIARPNGQNRAADWKRAGGLISGVAAGLLLFIVVAPSAVVGTSRNAEYLSSWIHRVAANRDVGTLNDFNLHSVRNQSLTNSAYLMGNSIASILGAGIDPVASDDNHWKTDPALSTPMDQPAVYFALLGLRVLLLVMLLAAGWKSARYGGPLAMSAAFALACMLTLLVSPLSWVHHFVLWLPALWLVPFWLWRQDRRPWAVGLLLAAGSLVWIHYLLLPIAGRFGLLGIGATVWFMIAAMALLRSREPPLTMADGHLEVSRDASATTVDH
jgi:hypothetical protein